MDEAIRRLQQTGIPRKHIFVERNFRPDAAWLHRGDHLTVCSLRELGYGVEMFLANLVFLCDAGITLRSLDDEWYDMTSGDPKKLLQGLCGLCTTKRSRGYRSFLPDRGKRRGRPPGLTATTEVKCQKCAELLATTNRTQDDILSSLHLSHRTWKRYETMRGLNIRKGKKSITK